jgi:hypothetical protein
MMKQRDNAIILDDIPFSVTADQCFELLRIKPGSRHGKEFADLLEEARAIARPKAAFHVAVVHERGEAHVIIDGVRFDSSILRINLEESPVVFPFVATCGHELNELSDRLEGTLHLFWADTLKMLALGAAMSILDEHLKERVSPAELSCMNPGSLEDWPLPQQSPMFDLLGQAPQKIGVSLTKSYVLIPLKSVTGVQFVTQEKYFNCQLCPRENCEGRRVPYEANLYEKRYDSALK